jgi:hypothetical protein
MIIGAQGAVFDNIRILQMVTKSTALKATITDNITSQSKNTLKTHFKSKQGAADENYVQITCNAHSFVLCWVY